MTMLHVFVASPLFVTDPQNVNNHSRLFQFPAIVIAPVLIKIKSYPQALKFYWEKILCHNIEQLYLRLYLLLAYILLANVTVVFKN